MFSWEESGGNDYERNYYRNSVSHIAPQGSQYIGLRKNLRSNDGIKKRRAGEYQNSRNLPVRGEERNRADH